MSLKSCPECFGVDSFLVDYREGNVVCQDCGCVNETRIIDESAESRSFSKESSFLGSDDSKRICSANINLLSDKGLCTYISNKESPLEKWNQRLTQTGIDKTLNKGFKNIDEYCHFLHLSDQVAEEAKKTFKLICEKKALKGRQHIAVLAACIFMGARKSSQSRSIKELSRTMCVERGDIHRSISLIQKHMPSRWKLTPASEYAEQLAVVLKFPPLLQVASKTVARRAHDSGLVTGKNPMSVAAAAVYMVGVTAGCVKAFTEISEVASKKDVTIRNCYKVMYSHKHQLLSGFDCSLDINRLIM